MEVKLLDHTKLSNSVIGLRNCWDSYHNGGNYSIATNDITDEDSKFLDRIINKHKHETGAEFLTYIFDIKDISVGCQNQLVRHRHASYLVRSTRYCTPDGFVETGNKELDSLIKNHMQQLDVINASNDLKKYALPQATSTNVVMSINARSLKNFFNLRLDKSAHWEIKELANMIYKALPEEHMFLYADCIK